MSEQTGFIYRVILSLRSSKNGDHYGIQVIQTPVKETKQNYKLLGGGGLQRMIYKEKIGKVDTILLNSITREHGTIQFHVWVDDESKIGEASVDLRNRMEEYYGKIYKCVMGMQEALKAGLMGTLDPVLWKDNPHNPENLPTKNIPL